MKTPVKVLVVLVVFALILGSYWFFGKRTQEEIFAAAEQNPLVQIEDYSKGLLYSTFRLVTHGGQMRFIGKVEHGPFIFTPIRLGMGALRLTLDPFQVVTSPMRTLVENYPKLAKSYLDVLVNLGGQYAISGNIPEMEILIPSEGDDDIIFNFAGMTLEGSGVDGSYNMSGLTKTGSLLSKQMEATFNSIAFSASGNEIFKLIPSQWKSDFTLNKLAMSWFNDSEGQQNINVETIVAKFQGGIKDGMVNAGSLYQAKGMVLNGQKHGMLDYSVNIRGLNEDGLNRLAGHVSHFFASSGEEVSLNTFDPWLPIVYKALEGEPELEIRVKSFQPSYGENEGMFKIQLLDEEHLNLPARIMAGISLDFDARASTQLVGSIFFGNHDFKDASVESQEKVANTFLAEMSSDIGIIEKADDRYLFNASYSGKEGFIRYGKSGHTLFIDQFLELLMPLIAQ